MANTTPTAIRDRSTTDIHLVKSHLRIVDADTTFDTILTLYLGAAKELADLYCQNPFTVSGAPVDIPMGVELWLVQTVATFYVTPERNVSTVDLQRDTSVSYKLADLDVDYGGLKMYRLEVGFGSRYF